MTGSGTRGRPRNASTFVAGGARRRGVLALTVCALALVVVAAALAVRPGDHTPLDPRGTGPDGLAGIVDLLRQVGVHVDISLDLPVGDAPRVFVPLDLLTEQRRAAVLEWVEDGGTLVVAGASRLHGLETTGGSLADVFGTTAAAPDCDLAGLADIGEVRHAAWVGLRPPDTREATTCFPTGDGDTAWLVVIPRGAGTLVALGSAAPLTNRLLGDADNAALAAALLGPAAGERLVILPRPPVGEGDTSLTDLVPGGVWRGLFLVLVALVLGILWRSRRLGPPVAERLPPVLPSAELAHSVADLLQRVGDRESAATRLRFDTREAVARALGTPAEVDPAGLAILLTARTGLPPDAAHEALVDRAVPDDAALVRVAEACGRARAVVVAGSARSMEMN